MNKMKNSFESMDDEMGTIARRGGNSSGAVKMIIAVIIIIAIALGAIKLCWGGYQMFWGDPIARASSAEWQAVFLVNGQVYFGKVNSVNNKTLTLKEIYYLQVTAKPLQSTQQGVATATDAAGNQELTLIKLGNEIHGPTDRMVINRDQIVLTEVLRTDSRVVQAISKYIVDQKKSGATAQDKAATDEAVK